MKYEIMMSCGHEDTVELFGKEKERDRKIEYFKIHGLCKECYRKKKEEEIIKATSIGAKSMVADSGLFAEVHYRIALERQKEWREKKEKIDLIKKPAVPEVLKGCTWNQKIYGKAGNYSIYPNGDKKLITDEQAEEIKNYLTLKEEYRKKVNEIKNA